MLKILAFIMLVPFSAAAGNVCNNCEKVFHIKETHPKLKGMEVQMDNGEVISLSEFLENISEDSFQDDIKIFGGEVPWPKPGQEGKNKKGK